MYVLMHSLLSLLLYLAPFLVLTIVLAVAARRPTEVEKYPFRKNRYFLNDSEKKLFYALKEIAAVRRLHVFAKVRMEDLLWQPDSFEKYRYRAMVKSRHIDFVLCDYQNIDPVLGIELDGPSHDLPERIERDAFVNDVFADAGLPLLHIPVADFYDPKSIAAQISAALSPGQQKLD